MPITSRVVRVALRRWAPCSLDLPANQTTLCHKITSNSKHPDLLWGLNSLDLRVRLEGRSEVCQPTETQNQLHGFCICLSARPMCARTHTHSHGGCKFSGIFSSDVTEIFTKGCVENLWRKCRVNVADIRVLSCHRSRTSLEHFRPPVHVWKRQKNRIRNKKRTQQTRKRTIMRAIWTLVLRRNCRRITVIQR